MHASPSRRAPIAQGIYYVATGVWPIVHLPSFLAVTGRKTDDWLVRTVGALVAVVGGALLIGAAERRRSRALGFLGVGSALALAAADVIFVRRRRIPPVYLADAAAELGLAAAWAADARR